MRICWGFKLESDGDIHLVVAQPGNRADTMIAEIPDPNCMEGAAAAYVRDVEKARLEFVKAYGIPPVRTLRLAYRPITLTGPAFFDFSHGQDGLAPTGIENSSGPRSQCKQRDRAAPFIESCEVRIAERGRVLSRRRPGLGEHA